MTHGPSIRSVAHFGVLERPAVQCNPVRQCRREHLGDQEASERGQFAPPPRRHGGTPRAARGTSRVPKSPDPAALAAAAVTDDGASDGSWRPKRASPAPAQLRARSGRLCSSESRQVYSVALIRGWTSTTVRPSDRRAFVLVERAARLLHPDPSSHVGTDGTLRGQTQQIGVDLVGHVPAERVEAEPPHAGVDRVGPGHHDGDDVDVPDAGHPQRPPGHAVGVVVREPDRQVAAAVCRAAPRALDEVAPGQVVDHVRTGVVGGDQHRLDEVFGGVVDHQVGSERGAQCALLGTAGHRDHPGARRLAQLDPGGAQPARGGVHHQGLTGLEPPPFEQGQVGGLEREQERSGLDVVEAGRSVEHRDGVGDRVLGDAAERVLGDGHHPLAQPRLGALAHLVDHPADVHPQGERRRRRHRHEVPPAAVDVVEVERGRADLHPDLLRPRARDARRCAPPAPLPAGPWRVTCRAFMSATNSPPLPRAPAGVRRRHVRDGGGYRLRPDRTPDDHPRRRAEDLRRHPAPATPAQASTQG